MGARAERRSYYSPAARLGLVEDDLDAHEVELGDHEGRLRALERIGFKVLGAAIAGGSIAGIATAVVTAQLGGL